MPTTLLFWEAKAGTPPSSNAPDGGYEDGTNFQYHYLSFALNEKILFHGIVPTGYGGGNVDVKVRWLPPAGTSGALTWGNKFLGREDGETFDSALSAQQTQADAVQDVGDLQECTISHVSPALAVGDALVLEVELTSALTGGNARMISVELQEQ